jgi:hypothetical protein
MQAGAAADLPLGTDAVLRLEATQEESLLWTAICSQFCSHLPSVRLQEPRKFL